MISEDLKTTLTRLESEISWINGISSEYEYQEALKLLSYYMCDESTHSFFVKMLARLVADYEQDIISRLIIKNDNGEEDKGLATLKTLMAHHRTKGLELIDVLGSRSLVSQIINGKRSLTIPHIYALARFYKVSPALFI